MTPDEIRSLLSVIRSEAQALREEGITSVTVAGVAITLDLHHRRPGEAKRLPIVEAQKRRDAAREYEDWLTFAHVEDPPEGVIERLEGQEAADGQH